MFYGVKLFYNRACMGCSMDRRNFIIPAAGTILNFAAGKSSAGLRLSLNTNCT